MAKLERVTHKLFAENAPIVESGTTQVEIGQFGSALAGTYVATNDVETLQALPAYTRGWGGAVIPDSNFPTLEDMNAVQRVQSYQTGYLYQEGIPEYDANTTYYKGSVCKIYQDGSTSIATSLIDENTGNPLTDTNSWSISPLIAGDVLRYNRITNCLLEVPQNIKLELNDGTLTLKAGSVVIVPYGTTDRTSEFPVGVNFINSNFEVFDTSYSDNKFFVFAKTKKDLSYKYTGSNAIGLFKANLTTSSGAGEIDNVSGDSVTIKAYRTWYDTVNNYVKRSTDGVTWSSAVFSLPCAEIMMVKDVGVNYARSFNGMGYIGSTVWADKGVQGLIPNGRNEDGSLNNVEVITSKISMQTFTTNTITLGNGRIVIYSNGNIGGRIGTYDFVNNYNLASDGVTKITAVTVAENCIIENGIIKEMNFKLPFRAVDYNTLVEIPEPIGFPDYTKGVNKSYNTTYTADQNGFVFWRTENVVTGEFYVDEILLAQAMGRTGSWADCNAILVPVSKNDTYRATGGMAFVFYPLK